MRETKRQPGKPGWRFALYGLVAAVLLSAVVRSLWVDVFYIPSASMEPLFSVGDRILVSRVEGPARRGDVVVFDGRGSFAPLHSSPLDDVGYWLGMGRDSTYVKRVIGEGGDRVVCCTRDRITVNGQPLPEPYLYPGDTPSRHGFDVTVPAGRLWLMGDHRSVSADSRALLGAPGGGMVRVDRVIGKPVQIIWPLDRVLALSGTAKAD